MLNPHLQTLLRHVRLDRVWHRGRGSWLEDTDGNRVLDLTAQYGAVPFGHNPEVIWEAVARVRSESIPAMVQPSRPLEASRLADRLADIAPITGTDRPVVTFGQSGAEVVELAIRLARASTGRSLIVAAERGYHGKTLGAAAASWHANHTMKSDTRPPGFTFVPFGDSAALASVFAARGHEIAAVLLEPIQGEGGVFEATHAYWRSVRALCDDHDCALILDEIQTGLGRVGAPFAANLYGLEAEIVLLAKALGGGLVPLAACIASRAHFPEAVGLSHGSTFANNNLTAAVGNAVLDVLEADTWALASRIDCIGETLRTGLETIAADYPGVIAEIRGRAGLIGLSFAPIDGTSSFAMAHVFEAESFAAVAASYLLNGHGLRVVPCLRSGNVLRIQPSLTVTDGEIQIALDALRNLARAIHHQDWAHLLGPVIGLPSAPPAPEDCRALSRRVVSSTPIQTDEPATRFAFLMHHTSPADLVRTSPALARLDTRDRVRVYDWIAARPGHAPVCFMPAVRSKDQGRAQGWLVALSHTPESMLARGRVQASAEIREAVIAAQRLGATVVGLGAFTSIMTRNARDLDDLSGAITTGNALTVAMAVDGVKLACETMGVDPDGSTALVLGMGAVGTAAATIVTEFVPRVIVVGNPARAGRERQKFERLADTIYRRAAGRLLDESGALRDDAPGVTGSLRRQLGAWARLGQAGENLVDRILTLAARTGEPDDGHGLGRDIHAVCVRLGCAAPLRLDLQLQRALPRANLVIAASSAANPLIGPRELAPGAIVCDVAKPADVSRAVERERDDVLVFDGGLAEWPEPIQFGQNIGQPAGTNLACLTETVLLALEGVESGRFGVAIDALIDDVTRIREAARRHGFRVAALQQNGVAITPQRLARIRVAANRARADKRTEESWAS